MAPDEDVRELLAGTWIGIALIVESLISRGTIQRDELILPLTQAEALATSQRRVTLAALRRLIATGFCQAPQSFHCRHLTP